ncbi:MAG: hypothetical protein WB791_04495 [Waddliaceae bacterium]
MTLSGPSPLGGGHHRINLGEKFPLSEVLKKTMNRCVLRRFPQKKEAAAKPFSYRASLESPRSARRVSDLGAHSLLRS